MKAKKSKRTFRFAPRSHGLPLSDIDESASTASGRVQFDERGNALWEWAEPAQALSKDSGANDHVPTLDHPLSIADDGNGKVENGRSVVQAGYDPYDRGKPVKGSRQNKKDLRRLSEWVKLKKQVAANKKHQNEEG